MIRNDLINYNFLYIRIALCLILVLVLILIISCQQPATNTNTVSVNSNANLANNSNSMTNTNSANTNTVSTNTEAKEPEQYQAKVTLKFEATGNQKTTLPNITANIARNGADRRMQFNLPNGEPAVYLDKPDTNYLILPNRKQYAVLDRESLGFDIQQMMMPAEIVNRIKTGRGIERVGEEDFNGRQVIRYRYNATANTQTQAGQINTDSFFLVDKQTGLPIYSETVSQSQSGNVQGYNGVRIISEISDISTVVSPELFSPPTDFQKIDAQEVRAQVNLVFNAVAVLLNQAMKSVQTNSNSAAPATSPTPR